MKITRQGKEFATLKMIPEIGAQFPNFTVTNLTGAKVTLADLLNQPLLISVVPDINTRVCSLQTKHFNEEVDQYSEINFVTISTNTPEQQANWCAAQNVQRMQLLSDINHNFGKATGLLMGDTGLLARSVWVINPDGQITYREIVEEMTDEPNYAQVLDQINQN
ncbi:thiol peroxidase [Bombilactobacillus bombi]|uniref:thiol peroxidase n=1 Tax=Bombilactobacillus bombi TaxID=1303590 RepID=UPI0015E6061E|nr:thiol peroxidase [Bombilactobacillus bombi]MBA1434455.1 thiol peroxidase [Bombilactobacillus bombi]